MKKTRTLLLLALMHAYVTFAQRDPSNEILVFFKEGVTREVKTVNGETVFVASIRSSRLRADLLKLDIDNSSLEIANPRFNEADTLKVLSDGSTIVQLNMTKLFRLKVPEGKSKSELIDKLNKLPEVLYAEANGTVRPYVIPNDTQINDQWGLVNTVTPGADIHADPAWDIFTGNPNNIIAIIDGGTDINHVDLNEKIAGGDTGFGWGGHGIHVSGIAAAESNNAQGVSGVDWNARIHAQRIDNAQDDVDSYNAIVDAVNFSADVRVLNNSWGTLPEGRYSITLRQAFALAYKANRTSVVAMGNHQLTQPGLVAYPAGFDNVIAVGATDMFDFVANFSVHGAHIDVSAPGEDILSTFAGGGYVNQTGTSMAAPHVSGIASLLSGFNNNLANDDIENLIRLSADDLNNPGSGDGTGPGFDASSGAGRVNAERALNFLIAPSSLNQWTVTGGTITSSTSDYSIQFYTVPGLAAGNYIAKRHEVTRSVTFPISFCQLTGAWGRGVSTTGWSVANPNYGEGFCEVVPGTLTNAGATLRTYIYEVKNTLGQFVGWYPTTASNVMFAYTALGILNPQNVNITGPSKVCISETYTVNNVPSDFNFSWSKSENLGIQGTSGNSVTVNKLSNGSGWVRATLTAHGCSIPITRDVQVGAFTSSQITILGSSGVCSPSCYDYTAVVPGGHQPGYTYNWTYPTGWFTCGKNENWICLCPPSGWSGSGSISVSVNNGCGSGSRGRGVFSSCGSSPLAYFPNPANDEFTVSFGEDTEAESSYGVKIFDARGNLMYSTTSNQEKITIPTGTFPQGRYILNIIYKEGIIRSHIFISR